MRTALYEEDPNDDGAIDRDIYYVDAEPTPGRSPRLAMPLPTELERYSSAHAPALLFRARIAAGDVSVLDRLAALDDSLSNPYPVASEYGRALCRALESRPDLSARVLAAVDTLPERLRAPFESMMRVHIASADIAHLDAFASHPRYAEDVAKAREVHAKYANEPAKPYVPSFDWHPDAKTLARDANRAVRAVENGALAYLALHPNETVEVIVALECAIADQTEPLYTRLGAVQQLARIDRAYLLKSLATSTFDDPALASVATPLRLCPEPGQLAHRMVELGLVDAALVKDAEAHLATAVTVRDVLTLCGRTDTFNCETDVYPNGHERVLADLAKLVAPLLDDVIFEEVPHREDSHDGYDDYEDEDDEEEAEDRAEADDASSDPEQLPDAYRLRAFLPDSTYEVIAGDTSDWYDVPAMLGLLNVLCRARGSSMRFFEQLSGSQDAHIAVAPLEAIRDAKAAGILVLARPGSASGCGRDFENAVFAELLDHD